jgi:DNA/RNA-binding domain of Phe-tRNA-synthetase-like protein
MATRRKVRKQTPRKPAKRPPKPMDEDEALGEELMRESRKDHDLVVAEFDKFLKQIGIDPTRKPIGAKQLRDRILKRGLIHPEANEFSRAIIEMREE